MRSSSGSKDWYAHVRYHAHEKMHYLNPVTRIATTVEELCGENFVAFGNDQNDIELFEKALFMSSDCIFPALQPCGWSMEAVNKINHKLWLLRSCKSSQNSEENKRRRGSRGFSFRCEMAAIWEQFKREEIRRVIAKRRRIYGKDFGRLLFD